jgi:hypothetical protein
MLAMQYEISLPADYDMGIIRQRVARAAPVLDAFAGLGLKAYVIREKADGSPVNQYAPFYLWNDVAAMGRFLWGGGGFERILDSFGRPGVRFWTGLGYRPGRAFDVPPKQATRQVDVLSPEVDPIAAVAQARDALEARAEVDGVHSAALAIDPHRWELVRYTLWRDAPEGASESGDETRYEVLHLSTPEPVRGE